jgi:hypothetical protein
MNSRQKKTHLTVLTGRHGVYKAETRQKTTRYPLAGESIHAHVILLRAPVQRILERQLARGYSLEEHEGQLAVTLDDPITAAHYVEALVAAYSTINLPRESIINTINTQAFGKDARVDTESYISDLLEGASPEVSAKKYGRPPQKIGKLKLVSETSKMGCHSFNLPPGPVYQGGTCPASQLGFMYETDEELAEAQKTKTVDTQIVVPDFICNGCYALKAAYGNPSMVFMMTLRLLLTQKWIRSGEFSGILTDAITRARKLSRRRLKRTPADKSWTIPHPDYFRIHDAGDFFSPAYTRAWFEVCRALPDMHFWSPTRMWATKKQASTVFSQGIPQNLALRPSALHFGEPAPDVWYAGSRRAHMPGLAPELHAPGLSAGSGSGPNPKHGDWPCPAYEHPERGGGGAVGRGGRIVGGTCSRAHGPHSPFHGGKNSDEVPMQEGGNGCRACWSHRTTAIFYHEH